MTQPMPIASGRRAGLLLLLVLLLFILGRIPLGAAELPLDGTWKWTFIMSDGTRTTPRVKLSRQGNTLSGRSVVRPGPEAPITEGKVQGNQVSWSVVREHDGRKVTTRYQGQWLDDIIKGTIESDWAGETRRYEWEARRVPNNPAGTWRWTTMAGGARAPTGGPGGRGGGAGGGVGGGRPGGPRGGGETKGTFAVDGAKVTGKVAGFGGDLEIKRGKFVDGLFSFEVVRERDGVRIITRYQGKVNGDTIKGESETDFGLEIRRRPWEATRVVD